MIRSYPSIRSDKGTPRLPLRLGVNPRVRPNQNLDSAIAKEQLTRLLRILFPSLLALSLTTAAHAQGTMDFSGAQTLMGTFNQRFAYVAVSRGSHHAQIFTDDATSLIGKLSHDVAKSSALQVGQQFTTDHGVGFQM